MERHIPILPGEGLDLLKAVGGADELWFTPVLAPRQVGQGAVIVTAAHTEPVAMGVEGDQRCQDQIQCPDMARVAPVALRLGNAETVGD